MTYPMADIDETVRKAIGYGSQKFKNIYNPMDSSRRNLLSSVNSLYAGTDCQRIPMPLQTSAQWPISPWFQLLLEMEKRRD